jgi:hypothetical protein
MVQWIRLFRRDVDKADLDAEIESHLAMAAVDKLERGVDPESGRQQARREFGSISVVKDVTREIWGWLWLDRLGQDIRYALRQIRRSSRHASSKVQFREPDDHMTRRHFRFKPLASVVLLLASLPAAPYSVQTHEQLIDLAWRDQIRPILQKRFPGITEPQLQEAHAYAYGGSAIQDYGYYPFGNAFFSDLTHYVRSGDFVLSLLHDAKTPDDLAFAIGALSHYIGDNLGHRYAVNQSVPVEFPKLEKKYGPAVNYAQSPHAHVRTEFAFDVNQFSKDRFAPSGYLQHVGLEVSGPLLRTVFYQTYGLDLRDLVGNRTTASRLSPLRPQFYPSHRLG